MRATASGDDVVVVCERGGGLRADRSGPNWVLRLVAGRCAGHSRGPVGLVRVGWLCRLFAVDGSG